MPEQQVPDLRISPEKRTALIEYLYDELTASKLARAGVEEVWEKIQRMYDQLDVPEKKDYPFEGAANVMIPIIPTYVEQVHARLMDTLYAPEDTYAVKPTNEDLHQFARAVRRWLTWASKNELMEESADYSSILQLLKLGTMVQKVVYLQEDVVLQRWNEGAGSFQKITERMKDNPEYIDVHISDFFWQMHARRIEQSTWRAHRIRLSWNEIKQRVAAGRYDKDEVEKIRQWYETGQTPMQEEESQIIGIEPALLQEFELYEFWFEYPLDADSPPTDEQGNIDTELSALPVKLQAVIHADARVAVQLKYNTFPLGLDPFEIAPFVGRELQVLGIGIGHMALPFQIEITAMHNQRLDNATVVNTVSFKYKADASFPADMKITPGGGLPVDEMDDIETFSIGSKADSSIQAEQQAHNILQERIGIRELALDDVALSKAPATTTLAILQEKGRRLDGVLRTIRRFKKRMMLKTVLLYKRYYPRQKLIDLFGQVDGALIVQMLDGLSEQQIWDNMGIEIAATTSATSRELEKRSKMEMFNVLMAFYDKYLGYVQAASNPQLPPPLQQLLLSIGQGLAGFVDELMADYNLYGRAEFIPNFQEILAQTQALPGPAPNGAGAAPPGSAVQPAGVRAAPQGAQAGGA